MSSPIRRASRSWLSWSSLALVLLAASACGDDNEPPTGPSPSPNPPTPATVTAGRITQSPAGIGVVLATSFTFTAEGFSASDNSALTYTWDFGDGVRQTGGAAITHMYGAAGSFTVTATGAIASGASATATLRDVAAATVTGRWGLQDVSGAFIMQNSSLNQNGTNISGDDTLLNCRFAIVGTVVPQKGIALTWTREQNDCAGRNLPISISFIGTVTEVAGGFLGNLGNGDAARLVPCSRPSCS